ncbi:Uncharacterised protein [uncultured archaeon]|nr:Uncharacterised protein [uncultured archaeon]
MARLTGFDWLKAQIEKLVTTTSKHKELIKKITEIEPNVYNEFREWTPLKLILLNYSLQVCTKIIENCRNIFRNTYYVDLFSGAGINKIKDKDDFFIGSPLIAALNHSNSYSELIFCENNPKYANALDLRLRTLNKNNLTIKQSYESCLSHILGKVDARYTYSFFFIDPFSFEFTWEAMEKVLKVRSDIVFTFMTSEIYRAVCSARKGYGGKDTLNKMFGNQSWITANHSEELVDIYKGNILKNRPNAPILTIKINSDANFYYHLFFITNQTKNRNQWLRAIEKAKNEIEKNSSKAVRIALEIVKKKQTQLVFEK